MRRALIVCLAFAAVSLPAHAGTTSVFAHVPAPGYPEGIAIHNGVVYTGSHVGVQGNGGSGPSKIFAFDLATGAPTGSIAIQGQELSKSHGVVMMAFDAAGRLYVLDHSEPARMIRIDLQTGAQQTYATFADIPSCLPGGVPLPSPAGCSSTAVDLAAYPDFIVFDATGNAYVTDLEQAVIWRVPPGGGAAKVWFEDARLDGVFGPNGIAISADSKTMYFAMTGSQQPTSPALGIIYSLPLVDEPRNADLHVVHTFSNPADGPDGIALGASGKLYVALAGGNQIAVLDATGNEAARFPDAIANAQQPVPWDTPASIAFDGAGNILVTNQSFFAGSQSNWAILRVFVGDTARPLYEPSIP